MTNSKSITAKDDKTGFQLPSFADEGRYLRTIMDSIPSGVVVIDAETRRIVDANPAALKMIGAARDNVIGVICHQFICPAAQGQCPICDLGQSVDNSERVLLTAQGGVIPIIKNVVTITLEAREYLIESFVDISHQQQTEDELRMLSRAVEQSTNTVIITDTNGIIEYVNPRFTQTAGYTPEEVIGQHTRILKSDETPSEAYQELWATITSGKIWRGEFRNKKKNGDLYWESVAISPVTDETGQIRHFLSMKEEITERKLAEEALRRSEEQFRTILETTPVPTLVSRVSDGAVLYANDPLGEMFGTTPEALMGNITPDFYHNPADRQVILEKMKQEGQLRNFELQVKKLDGTPFWTIFSMQMMVYGGESAFMVGFSDITERKRTEVALAKRAVELETVAEVGAAASTILDAEALLQQVVDLTKERFNLYHAHIYLLDDITNKLNLSAGAGDVGRKMTAQGWSIPLDREHSLVARAARMKQGITINDVRQEPGFFPNPLLPDTRSELAVPLIAGDTVLGVLDVQADEVDYFTEQDAQIQSTLASQVAVALQNARLFVEQEKTSLLLQERVKGLNLLNEIGQETDDVPPIPQFLQWVTERIPTAMQYAELCIAAIEFDGQVYGQPKAIDLPAQVAYGLYIGGKLEGRLYTAYTEKREFINEESAMLGAVATRVSGYIENRRLFEQTEYALDLTERLYEAGRRLNTAEDLQAALTAVIEVVPASEVNRAVLFMFEQNQAGENETATVLANWHSGEGTLPTPIGTQYQWSVIQAFQFAVGTEAFFFDDTFNDDRVDAGTMAVFRQQNIRALAALPIWVGGRQLGTLLIEAEDVHHFTDEEIEPYTTLARQLAVFIDRQQLFEQTQAALEEANFLRRAVEQSFDGSAVADMTGNILFANSAWIEMHGYDTEEELLGQPLSIFHTEEQLQNEVAFFDDQVMQKGAYQGEVGHKRKDGTTFSTWMTVTVLLDADGNPTGLAAAAQDITERKQVEAELKRERQLFVDGPAVVFRWVNAEGWPVEYASPNVQQLIGHSAEDLTSGQVAYPTVVHPDDLMRVAEEVQTYSEEGRASFEQEYRMVRADGEIIWIYDFTVIVRNEYGEITHYDGYILDITERKKLEESLKENEALYESLLNAIPQRLYRIDLQGHVVFGNKAYQELMGMGLEELRGKTIYDLAPKELADKYTADEERVMQSGETFEDIEIHRELSTGKTTYVQIVKSPVRDWSGEIIGLQGIFWDVTEQKEAELERERLLKEVETAYRQYVRQEWEQFLEERHRGEVRVEVKQALSSGDSANNGSAKLETPISLRGQTIGKLQLEALEPEHKWSEDESALVQAVSEQLALTVENLRLFDDTRQRATREQLTRQITDKMRAAPDVDSIIESGLSALAKALNVPRAYVKLTPEIKEDE